MTKLKLVCWWCFSYYLCRVMIAVYTLPEIWSFCLQGYWAGKEDCFEQADALVSSSLLEVYLFQLIKFLSISQKVPVHATWRNWLSWEALRMVSAIHVNVSYYSKPCPWAHSQLSILHTESWEALETRLVHVHSIVDCYHVAWLSRHWDS